MKDFKVVTVGMNLISLTEKTTFRCKGKKYTVVKLDNNFPRIWYTDERGENRSSDEPDSWALVVPARNLPDWF